MAYTRFFHKTKLTEGEYKGDDYYKHHANDYVYLHEIELWIENDSHLYRSQFEPIIKNIQRKIKAGKYNHSMALKLWMYLVENGLKQYVKENRMSQKWNEILSINDRKLLAQKLADENYDAIVAGEYD